MAKKSVPNEIHAVPARAAFDGICRLATLRESSASTSAVQAHVWEARHRLTPVADLRAAFFMLRQNIADCPLSPAQEADVLELPGISYANLHVHVSPATTMMPLLLLRAHTVAHGNPCALLVPSNCQNINGQPKFPASSSPKHAL